MSVNRYKPHLLVLPEDDANRQTANGFALDPSIEPRGIQVMDVAGGCRHVLALFASDYAPEMGRLEQRHMVLLIDFDGSHDRLAHATSAIPAQLRDRVFVLGAQTTPEHLTSVMALSLEAIGFELARDCRQDQDGRWGHELLRHNSGELARLRDRVRPFLFPHNQD